MHLLHISDAMHPAPRPSRPHTPCPTPRHPGAFHRAGAAKPADAALRACPPCGLQLPGQKEYLQHQLSPEHLARTQEVAQATVGESCGALS